MSDLGKLALSYARHGWKVFPLVPRGKEPLAEACPHGHLDATSDPEVIGRWWDTWPAANIGAPAGPNGFLGLDVDPRNGGHCQLDQLRQDHDLPLTPTAETGGGGVHYLFRDPDYRTRGRAGDGIDVKRAGYIVVPPSIHPNGRPYRWADGLTPDKVSLAEVPEWLEAAIRVPDHEPEPRPSTNGRVPSDGLLTTDQVAERAVAALAANQADDYDTWVMVGMACRSVGDHLFSLWCEWSATSPKFPGSSVCRRKWDSFGPDGVGLGSLVKLARDNGSDLLMPGSRRKELRPSAPAHHTNPPVPPVSCQAAMECCGPGHRCDDIGNAGRFVELFGHEFRYCHEWKTWLHFDGRRWAVDSAEASIGAAKEVARSILLEAHQASSEGRRRQLAGWASGSAKRPRVEAMLALARPDLAVSAVLFDADPYLLNCRTGTIDLRTGDLRPHSDGDYISRMVEADYQPEADLSDEPGAVLWRHFIADTTAGSEGLDLFLQVAAGYSVSGDTAEEVLFFFHGLPRTGKSTFLDTVRHHLADYADQVDFSVFLRKREESELRPELDKLRGRRFVASCETTAGRALAEGLVKNITGGESISTRPLYGAPTSWRPSFHLFWSANDRPRVRHEDLAMWRRFKVVPFNNQKAAPDDLDAPEHLRADRHLKQHLREQSGEAVLAWLVRGCRLWQATGLPRCPAVDEALVEYQREMDPLGDWLAECCTVTKVPGDWTETAELHKSYIEWCETQGEKHGLSRKAFGQQLTHLLGPGRRRRSSEKTMVYGYDGIHLGVSERQLFLPGDPGDPGDPPDVVESPCEGRTRESLRHQGDHPDHPDQREPFVNENGGFVNEKGGLVEESDNLEGEAGPSDLDDPFDDGRFS